MKERPILFSAPMVRALLAGTKTQTRRIIKPEWSRCLDLNDDDDREKARTGCPYGTVGDRLWVKETIRLDDHDVAVFGADGALTVITEWPWKRRVLTAIHTPRGASRITLDVTSVRVEQLQAITEADALAEGVAPVLDLEGDCWTDGKAVTAYQYLWNEINGWDPNSWDSNPWVWIVEFKCIATEPSW